MRGLDAEVREQIRKQTKLVAEPVWQEEVRAQVTDRMQTRVLSDSARVSTSDQNVMLRSGGVGKTGNTPNSVLAAGVEFGADRNSTSTVRGNNGTYKRHARRQFKLPRRRGYVVYPAARNIIPRLASLWVQTTVRTIHEALEKGGVH